MCLYVYIYIYIFCFFLSCSSYISSICQNVPKLPKNVMKPTESNSPVFFGLGKCYIFMSDSCSCSIFVFPSSGPPQNCSAKSLFSVIDTYPLSCHFFFILFVCFPEEFLNFAFSALI